MKQVLIFLLLLASPAMAGGSLAQNNAGAWHGVGIQVDALDWPMELTLRADGADVAYSTLECGGEWRFFKATGAQVLAFENITVGVDKCLDGGLVQLQPYRDGMLIYRWFDNTGTAVAAAVLIPGAMRTDTYDALLRLTLDAVGDGFVSGAGAENVSVGEIKT